MDDIIKKVMEHDEILYEEREKRAGGQKDLPFVNCQCSVPMMWVRFCAPIISSIHPFPCPYNMLRFTLFLVSYLPLWQSDDFFLLFLCLFLHTPLYHIIGWNVQTQQKNLTFYPSYDVRLFIFPSIISSIIFSKISSFVICTLKSTVFLYFVS